MSLEDRDVIGQLCQNGSWAALWWRPTRSLPQLLESSAGNACLGAEREDLGAVEAAGAEHMDRRERARLGAESPAARGQLHDALADERGLRTAGAGAPHPIPPR